jgi:hypothetical protein
MLYGVEVSKWIFLSDPGFATLTLARSCGMDDARRSSPMPAKSKRVVQIIPIAPRIEQERLLRIVALEWLIREEKEKIIHALLAGATIAPGPVRAEVLGEGIAIVPA